MSAPPTEITAPVLVTYIVTNELKLKLKTVNKNKKVISQQQQQHGHTLSTTNTAAAAIFFPVTQLNHYINYFYQSYLSIYLVWIMTQLSPTCNSPHLQKVTGVT